MSLVNRCAYKILLVPFYPIIDMFAQDVVLWTLGRSWVVVVFALAFSVVQRLLQPHAASLPAVSLCGYLQPDSILS